jgi:putative transcriptional regulator
LKKLKPRKWLTKIRNDKGMTHQAVADGCNIERSFYTQIETGQRNPSVETAKKIASVLNFEWTIFFADNSGERRQMLKDKAV